MSDYFERHRATLDKAKKSLSALSGVGRIETLSRAKSGARIRAYSSAKKPIAADVAATLKSKKIAVLELNIEEGRLEDVFRDITTAETELAQEAVNA